MAYSVVLVGLGKMGTEYARAIASHPDLEVVGVVSPSAGQAQAFSTRFGILGAYRSLGEAYSATEADAVIISVPPRVVSEVLMEAWSYPWKCLTEKPAGRDLAESSNLVLEQNKAKMRPSVALNRRFYSQVQEIRTDLATISGQKFLIARDQYFVSKSLGSVREQLFEKAIHMVDLFSYILSDLYVESSFEVARVGEGGMLVSSRIDFSQGSQVRYSTALNIPGRWSINVYSEGVNWLLEPLEDGWRTDLYTATPKRMSRSDADISFKPGMFAVLDELVLELKGTGSRLPTLEDSHRSMILLDNIFLGLG